MVIFNGEEQKYTPKHIKHDNTVLDIRSDGTLSEVLSAIEGTGEAPANTEIKAYHPAGEQPGYEIDLPQTNGQVPYDNEFLTEEDIIDMDDDFYEEPTLLKNYRPFRNGVLARQNSFQSFDPPVRLLTDEIQDALGILPTVMSIDDPDHPGTRATVAERVRLSNVGNDLFWHFNDEEGRISSKNRYPDMETILYYDKFTPYEKRVVTEGHIHPRKYIELKRLIEQDRPGYVLTKQAFEVMRDVESDYYIEGDTPIYARGSRLSLDEVKDELLHPSMEKQHPDELSACIEKADAEFRRVIHRAPRVLPEYVLAHCLREGHILNDEEIRQMVADFSLPSLSKVARLHNFALYALADRVRFQEIPKEHIEAFATFLDPTMIKRYEERGFFNWYNAHKDIKTNDLMTVMDSVDQISQFDPEKTVTELIYDIRQNRGKRDAELFKRDYNIDFADTDLSIRGRNLEVTDGKYTILMLDAKDYRNLLVGYDTHCCQRFNEAGESCVRDIITSPTSGITAIVRNRDMKDGKWISGKCLAQAYTWVNEETSTIVFDNMEFADDRKVSEFSDLIAGWAARMPYKNMHVGSGYNQGMTGWGITVPKMVDKPVMYDGCNPYSDYHSNARALKNKDEMMLQIKHPEKLRYTERTLIPSRYDILNKAEVAWLENTGVPMQEKLHLAQDFLEHSDDPAVQLRAVSASPRAIRYITHPALEVQQQIVRNNPAFIPMIQNPDPSIYNVMLEQEPRAILKMEHPTKEAWQVAVSHDGLLLKNCPYLEKPIVLSAVRQNGIAVRFAGNLQNDPEIQKAAVEQTPLALKHLTNPTEEVTVLAAGKDIDSISKNTVLPVETQMRLVEENPANILNFKDTADPSVVHLALEKNGLLLRNFRHADPELQMTAVRQNGLAIRYVRDPDMELLRAAYASNPRSLRYMRISPQQKAELLNSLEMER